MKAGNNRILAVQTSPPQASATRKSCFLSSPVGVLNAHNK